MIAGTSKPTGGCVASPRAKGDRVSWTIIQSGRSFQVRLFWSSPCGASAYLPDSLSVAPTLRDARRIGLERAASFMAAIIGQTA
jgi:hypothetical protein